MSTDSNMQDGGGVTQTLEEGEHYWLAEKSVFEVIPYEEVEV